MAHVAAQRSAVQTLFLAVRDLPCEGGRGWSGYPLPALLFHVMVPALQTALRPRASPRPSQPRSTAPPAAEYLARQSGFHTGVILQVVAALVREEEGGRAPCLRHDAPAQRAGQHAWAGDARAWLLLRLLLRAWFTRAGSGRGAGAEGAEEEEEGSEGSAGHGEALASEEVGHAQEALAGVVAALAAQAHARAAWLEREWGATLALLEALPWRCAPLGRGAPAERLRLGAQACAVTRRFRE